MFDSVRLPIGSLKDICLRIEYLLSISSTTCGINFFAYQLIYSSNLAPSILINVLGTFLSLV
ncbi:hypothetical protein H477_4620 [[Clostridium] sordellii ATCC 9714]|nr:hypothetical protein H477_4620 [[Clostridium] sordellii ATCC 9714] [Paeniclostridium sordellii ATCC 9714]